MFSFQLILTEIYYDGFHRTFHDSQLLTDIHETDNIYAIETPPILVTNSNSGNEAEHMTLVVLNKQGMGDQGRRWAACAHLRMHIPIKLLLVHCAQLHILPHVLTSR